MTRSRAIALALLVAGVFLLGSAELGRFRAADLERFESLSGVDLPDWYSTTPWLLTWTRGDGAAFVTLAADPTFEGPSNRLLSANYRYQRIGFALAGRAAVLGDVDLVPIGLIAVNAVAIAWYAASVVRLTADDRRAMWLLANPALYLGFAGSTAEPLGLALLLASVCSRRPVLATGLGLGLGAVRPSFATVLPAGRHGPIATVAAAGAFVVVWVVALMLGPGGDGLHSLTIPGTGYWTAITGRPLDTALLAGCALLALLTTLAVGLRPHVPAASRVAWLSTALLGLSLSVIVMNNPIDLLRALGALPVLWAVDTATWKDIRVLPSAHG